MKTFLDSFDQSPDRRDSGSLKWDLHSGDALPFWVADMDFCSPQEVISAVRQRVEHGVYGYAYPSKDEKAAILDYLRKRHGISAQGSWIVWVPGMVPALNAVNALAANRGAGSSLTATPIYPPFLHAPAEVGLASLRVPLARDPVSHLLTFDFPKLEKAAREDSGLFMLCHPHNPVGRVFSRDELDVLSEFCCRHDLLVCSDEIHCDLILDESKTPHRSLLHYENLYNRLIVLMSASKTYNIAGIGCAFAIIPDAKLRVAFRKAAGAWLPPVNVFGYAATAAAYRHGEPWRLALLEYLRGNFEMLRLHLNENHREIHLEAPEATYLAWLDVRQLPVDYPDAFFKDHGLIFSNGTAFDAPGFIRWNFGCPRSLLDQGLERFTAALKAL